MFITDLDHTFLRSDLTVSPYSERVWNETAREATLTVATARSLTKSRELLAALQIDAPMILLDGAMVVTPSGEAVALHTLDKERGDAVVERGLEFGIDPFVIGLADTDSLRESFLYPRRLNAHQKEVLKGYRDDPRLQFNLHNRTMSRNLKIVYFGEHARLAPLAEALRQEHGGEIECKLSPEKYGGGYFLTILHPRGDKAHALEDVAAYLERDLSEFTVFGDSINDLGMFARAGTAVAVANALDEVKAQADLVLPHTNDEDGVARYLAARHRKEKDA